MLDAVKAFINLIKTPVGAIVSIILLVLALVGFGGDLPVIKDAVVWAKGVKAYFQKKSYDSDIARIQKSIDSTRAVVLDLHAKNDSLSDLVEYQGGLIRKRGRSIDSINAVIKGLKALRDEIQSKKEVSYVDIKNHGKFVDSVFFYRDTALASVRDKQ